MLSKQEVYSRLAEHFVGLRFDWEQGNHYKAKFGFILGTGDQLLLTPGGELIRPEQQDKSGKTTVLYGRHGCDTTAAVLDGVIENQHGKWMRGQASQMTTEDDELRKRAAAGTLLPPGRKPGEPAPYVSRTASAQ